MSGANVETLRRGYDALNSGDLSVVLALLDPDIEWHEPAPSPDVGTHRGRDSAERFVRSWLESFDSFRVEPEQVAAGAPGPRLANDGDEIVIPPRARAEGRAAARAGMAGHRGEDQRLVAARPGLWLR